MLLSEMQSVNNHFKLVGSNHFDTVIVWLQNYFNLFSMTHKIHGVKAIPAMFCIHINCIEFGISDINMIKGRFTSLCFFICSNRSLRN